MSCCPSPRRAIQALAASAALAMTAVPAAAGPAWILTFTGVINNSSDSSGALFGAAPTGGQNNLAITGTIVIDSTGYTDLNPSVFNGRYEPNNGLFPQPLDFFTATFSIAGRNFNASEYMGPTSQHSIEAAAVQNIPPVNFVQQDIYEFADGSQRLLCSNPANPASCNGGALATTQLRLKLFGIYDFLGSDALVQPLNLNAAAIAAIVGAPGGGQANSYLMYRYSSVNVLDFDARGEFNLTSMTLSPVPEPATMVLLGVGVVALLLRSTGRSHSTQA